MPKQKKIKTAGALTGGKYQGEFGADAAESNPLAFYNHVLANEGWTGMNTAPDAWEYLQNQGFNNIFNGYEAAQVDDQSLNFFNYMANKYGATPGMSAKNPYAAQPAPATTPVQQQFGDPDGAGAGLLGGKRRRRRTRNPYAGNSVLGG